MPPRLCKQRCAIRVTTGFVADASSSRICSVAVRKPSRAEFPVPRVCYTPSKHRVRLRDAPPTTPTQNLSYFVLRYALLDFAGIMDTQGWPGLALNSRTSTAVSVTARNQLRELLCLILWSPRPRPIAFPGLFVYQYSPPGVSDVVHPSIWNTRAFGPGSQQPSRGGQVSLSCSLCTITRVQERVSCRPILPLGDCECPPLPRGFLPARTTCNKT